MLTTAISDPRLVALMSLKDSAIKLLAWNIFKYSLSSIYTSESWSIASV